MGVLGVGMGLIVSQLGNVVQSVGRRSDRSEAGGLQNTAAQLGSSLGTALLGAVVISGLITAFSSNVAADERIADDAKQQVEVRLAAGARFVTSDQVRAAAAEEAGVDPATDRRACRGLRGRADRRAEDRIPVRRADHPGLVPGHPAPAR